MRLDEAGAAQPPMATVEVGIGSSPQAVDIRPFSSHGVRLESREVVGPPGFDSRLLTQRDVDSGNATWQIASVRPASMLSDRIYRVRLESPPVANHG